MSYGLIDSFARYSGVVANTGLQAKWMGFASGMFNANMVIRATQMTGLTPPNAICPFVIFTSGTTYMLGLRLNNNGSLSLIRMTGTYAGTVLFTTAAGVIVVNTFHYLQVGGEIHDTAGTFEIQVDGVQVMNQSGFDSRNGTPTTVDTIQFGDHYGISWSGQQYIIQVSELTCRDTKVIPAQRRVASRKVIGDTTDKDFVASSGTDNFAMLDEATVSAADYVQGSNVGDLDLYSIEDLGSNPNVIDAVQLVAFAQKTDAAARAVALVADVLAVQAQTADLTLAGSIGKHEGTMETKPGGGAWTAADIGNLKIGPKVTV
jgi:hypothetical protein